MPLVVPALRFFVVFLNIYETFKTLKPLPPSARRAGQPSVRAASQRKRDLKGCLAVWVVWCCYAVYERTFDRVVGIFIPFYSEMKSVFLLFLVLTRAKGAEPLFLHVLRPLVKPYAAIVDPTLELSRDIGDFFFALLQVPLDYILLSPWFPSWCTGKSGGHPSNEFSSPCISSPNSGSSACMTNHSSIPILIDRSNVAPTSRVPKRHNGSIRSISDTQRSIGRPSVADSRAILDRRSSSTSLPAYSEHPSRDPPQYSQALPRHNGHQIWLAPTCPYAAASGREAPTSSLQPLGMAPEYHSSEWRTYPAFPSAYPPTPLPASVALPTSLAARPSDEYHLTPGLSYVPIPEDEQGFGEMVERAHEAYPGLVHSSSSRSEVPPGVHSEEESSDATRQLEEDTLLDDNMCSSEAGLSEDDFGISLRTPYRGPRAMPSTPSSDSLASVLTTTDNASSLRAKTSSDSLSSGSLSLVGRKRSHGASQGKARSSPPTSHSRHATLRGKPIPLPPQSSTSEDEDESEAGRNDHGANVKRQKVLDPLKRKSTVRPTARGSGNTRKIILSRNSGVRNRSATTITQETARTRAASAMTINSTIRPKKQTPGLRQVVRDEPQGVIKSSSTSSHSGTLKGRAY